ncbi:hypothetical protein ACFW25_41410 [Streptomyces tendae]|uniref:hypothetical protein n=1 Tax=Streptomyces tendae TaxID=1932 RepID=UPI0036D0C4F9
MPILTSRQSAAYRSTLEFGTRDPGCAGHNQGPEASTWAFSNFSAAPTCDAASGTTSARCSAGRSQSGRQLAERAGHRTPDGLQRLLHRTIWNADDARDDLQTYIADKLGEDGGGSSWTTPAS